MDSHILAFTRQQVTQVEKLLTEVEIVIQIVDNCYCNTSNSSGTGTGTGTDTRTRTRIPTSLRNTMENIVCNVHVTRM